MSDRSMNPRLLFALALVAAFVFTMIAIFVAMSYTPESARDDPVGPPGATATTPGSPGAR